MLELGGKDPLLVLDDADLDAAAEFACANSFENSGQTCVSTERVYVDRQVAICFEQRVVRLARDYRLGPGMMTRPASGR
ncbi:aldehyde dehydrogenase family protein [Marinobacterium aestuariivivens]|uniref:Aldehyde dehydrogenase family protein n=1 Tax=Marinobacterium aestuariivivens TaxID=1698799 RepID=A0ABW1ZU20_9GAMM